jgi:HD-GYP domain-containing protein (c-di-GMP phosphodiesterase class II)
MRLLSIDNVSKGMHVARTIYSAEGKVLLTEGMPLTVGYIERLQELGVASLYIIDDKIGRIEVDELVTVQTRIHATKIVKETMTNIKNDHGWDSSKVAETVNQLMDELIANRNIIYNLVDVRAMNDYTFSHSIAVCILSLMVGTMANFGYHKLKELGIGAILHDIGKVFVSDRILNKTGPLTPMEYLEVQKHTIFGYETLNNNDLVPKVSAHVAWQHHENYDGTGYPRGLKEHMIHEFARIVSLADVFDALSTDRIYRKRFLPHETIEFIRDKGKSRFDPEFSEIFLQRVAPFPVGTAVLLNTGEKAIVVKIFKDLPARPIVKVIINKDGESIPEPVDIDLKTNLTVYIVEALHQ